ncbi:Znfx1 [Symbiodinium sp. CCMP2592]|nr:Znfx1 [Symbiodinium sp. CCMP2592]
MPSGARSRKRGDRSSASDEPSAAEERQPSSRRVATALGVAAAVAVAGLAGKQLLHDSTESGHSSSGDPKIYGFDVVETYPHDPEAFTQGLLWSNGSLYESTGLYGRSSIREFQLGPGGEVRLLRKLELDGRDFGEGLVQRRGQLLQLLWRRGEGIRYRARAGEGGRLKKAGRFRTPLNDGWGIEAYENQLILTDSGHELITVDENFEVVRRVPVNDAGAFVEMVNELEMVGEELWANVYGTECLARIDTESGSVTGWVLLHGLLDKERATWRAGDAGSDAPDVLNGIAWDAASKRLFVTGKLWPHLYEIQVKPSQVSVEQARLALLRAASIKGGHIILSICVGFTGQGQDLVLGAKAPKKQRTVAEDATEILEASADVSMSQYVAPCSVSQIYQQGLDIAPSKFQHPELHCLQRSGVGLDQLLPEENMQTYEKCADYIQTHFMLLREDITITDYIEPLRAGIKLFMQGRHSPKDLHVYTGVKVVGVLSTWEGLVYRIELRREEIRKVSWDKSKQLMYGSLLCFSDDDFKSLIWATVWRRDPALISSKAQLDVRLPFDPWDDRLSPGKVFCCIENVTIYFEAYRHVLIALQNMRATDVPFQHTLLSQQPDPLPPTYLKEETDMFHFHNVFSSCEKVDCEVSAPKSFRILAEWPPALRQALDLDPSQLDAVQHALTNQMALIQGPPGTGKTFVGLKIVQAILDNTKVLRHSPVLVVCYTNHALDQFLEGIFKFCENIVRIGSRSKSEQMMRRNLKELVMSVPPSREFNQARKCLTERRDYLRDELSKAIVQVDSHTVSAAQAKSLMSEQQFEEFYQGFLDYLGDAKDDFPEDAWVVDDEIWSRVMKEWLGTSDPSRFAPVPKHQGGGLPSFKTFGLTEDSDDDDYAPYGSKDDGDEEEAANEIYERKLDVDNEQTEQVDEKRKSRMDFFQELNNAWLPYVDEYYETLTPEMRSLDWREENLWRLLPPQRRECYRQWLVEAHEEARGVLPELAHLLERNAESRAALDRDRKLAVLREMQVVGMTTTAVSKYQQLLKELRPEVVIVEEAAEVLEAHILTALHPRTQHVVLIGDHQQLRPSTAVYRLSKNFHLDVSLFERLIHNGAAHVTLLQQRRMHPKISRLIKPLYPQLRDHSSTEKYPEIRGVAARCFFMSHFHLEDDEGESHSKQNTFEANFVSALCAHLVTSGYEESQITVLSPYLGQVRLLKRKIQRDPSTQGIAVTAVDNFQGEENDVIVISLVRSNRARQMGFLAVDNRINVALTRARHGMFIVGNTDMLEKHTLWSQILRELKSDECLAETLPIVDKEQKGPFEVKSADEISVFLENKVHQSGGEGMITIDEYRKSQEVRKKKGQPRSRGDQADRWLEHKDAPARGGGTRKSYAGQNTREVEATRLSEDFKPPARMEASEIYDECELLPGKAEQDDDAGKRSKKKKQQKPKQVLHVRG